jgi:hypothetical protein
MSGTIIGPNGECRFPPKLPAASMKTYELRQPLATHFVEVSCAQANCARRENGFIIGFDLTVPAKVAAANELAAIANRRGMKWSYEVVGSTVQFTFAKGQDCFETHRRALEREPLYIVRNGDFRGNPRKERKVHTSGENFVDDFANHQDRLATRLEQG